MKKSLNINNTVLKIVLSFIVSAGVFVFAINIFVIQVSKPNIYDNYNDAKEAISIIEPEFILILGAGLKPDNTPSFMLKDRLDKGISIYASGAASRILLSGEKRDGYDEVGAMKKYCEEMGVEAKDIYTDNMGFSTFESIERAKRIFNSKSIIVVTQAYHLNRAIYISKKLDIDAIGINAKEISYTGQSLRDLREIVARVKDFFNIFLKGI